MLPAASRGASMARMFHVKHPFGKGILRGFPFRVLFRLVSLFRTRSAQGIEPSATRVRI